MNMTEVSKAIQERILRRFPFDYFEDTDVGVNFDRVYIGGNSLNKKIPNDFDLYPVNRFDFDSVQKGIVFSTKNSKTVKHSPCNIQFCSYWHPSLKELIESFDYSHIQIGALVHIRDREVIDLYYTEAYVKSHVLDSTEYQGSEYPLSSLIRILKYIERGEFAGKSYIPSMIHILTDIYKRGFRDYPDFKDQLDAVDLGLLPEDFDELDRGTLSDFFEVLRKDKH